MAEQIRIIDTPDSHGGIIREITAEVERLQEKEHIVPVESDQTVEPDDGYTGLSSVQIDAVPPTYVGSNIPRKSSSDLTIVGRNVNVPAGYYQEDASKEISEGYRPIPLVVPMTVQTSVVQVHLHAALEYVAIAGEPYEGPTTAEPILYNPVILQTKGKLVPDNITINPIQILDVDNPAGGYTVTIGNI